MAHDRPILSVATVQPNLSLSPTSDGSPSLVVCPHSARQCGIPMTIALCLDAVLHIRTYIRISRD